MQGNVFEASLSLVRILIAVLLFLKARSKGAPDRSAMNGIWSIIALFLAIGGAAFVTLAVSSGGASLDNLLDLGQLNMIDLFTHKEDGFKALILALYERLFYAVLIGCVILDVLKHEDGDGADKPGRIALPGEK